MKRLVFVLNLCLCGLFAYSQPIIDDVRRIPVLVFEHFEKKETRFIKQGGAVKYVLRGDKRQVFAGKLDSISEKAMVVNGKTVQFANCMLIKGRVRTDKEMIGGLLSGIGFTSIAFGSGLFGVTTNGAIASASAGGVAFAAGMALIFNKKKFNLNRGWVVRGGSIQYNLSE